MSRTYKHEAGKSCKNIAENPDRLIIHILIIFCFYYIYLFNKLYSHLEKWSSLYFLNVFYLDDEVMHWTENDKCNNNRNGGNNNNNDNNNISHHNYDSNDNNNNIKNSGHLILIIMVVILYHIIFYYHIFIFFICIFYIISFLLLLLLFFFILSICRHLKHLWEY